MFRNFLYRDAIKTVRKKVNISVKLCLYRPIACPYGCRRCRLSVLKQISTWRR